MVEKAPYDFIKKIDDIEIRNYPELIPIALTTFLYILLRLSNMLSKRK